jgi:hypothetical protein
MNTQHIHNRAAQAVTVDNTPVMQQLLTAEAYESVQRMSACLKKNANHCECGVIETPSVCDCGYHNHWFDTTQWIMDNAKPGLTKTKVMECMHLIDHTHVEGYEETNPEISPFIALLSSKLHTDMSGEIREANGIVNRYVVNGTLVPCEDTTVVKYKYTITSIDVIFGFQIKTYSSGVVRDAQYYTGATPRPCTGVSRDGYRMFANGPLFATGADVEITYNKDELGTVPVIIVKTAIVEAGSLRDIIHNWNIPE